MTRRSARRLPVHDGPAAWAELLGPPPAPRVLEEEITADVTVVGAGFAGLSAARRILQLDPEARVVVIDAHHVAEGAAGRNTGFMIDLPHDLSSVDYTGSGDDRTIIARNRHAIAFAASAVEEYDIPAPFFDRAGKINGAASPTAEAHNDSYSRHLDQLGEGFERLDTSQMRHVTGSPHYRSGLYTPGTVMLQPAGYIRGFARGLSRQATIFERTPVTGFARTGPDWRIETPRGAVTAGKMILTVNGHLESFGFERGRLIQLFLFASMTRELDCDTLAKLGGQSRWGITPSDPMGTTMRRIDTGQGGNRIITRTVAALRPNLGTGRTDVNRATAVQRRKFDERFPQIAGFPFEYAWAGHLCLSLNGVAVMRELEDGVFAGCVQNGLGTTRGTLTGVGAAELAMGHRSEITAHFGSEARPTRLPPPPFSTIGANALLRYREWRAGAE